MRAVAVLVVLVLPAFARAEDKPKFTIELTAPKEIYPDETLDIKAAIRNNTSLARSFQRRTGASSRADSKTRRHRSNLSGVM